MSKNNSEVKDLYEIKDNLNWIVEHDLNSYYHKDWTSPGESEKICDIILDLINKVEELEEKVRKFTEEDNEENMED